MTYVLDTAILGENIATFTNGPIEGLTYAFSSFGDVTSFYSALGSRRVLRAGWIAFGTQYDPGDGTTREFWSPPQFFEFESGFLFPPGRQNTAPGVGNYYDRVYWHLEPGQVGHIWVNTF